MAHHSMDKQIQSHYLLNMATEQKNTDQYFCPIFVNCPVFENYHDLYTHLMVIHFNQRSGDKLNVFAKWARRFCDYLTKLNSSMKKFKKALPDKSQLLYKDCVVCDKILLYFDIQETDNLYICELFKLSYPVGANHVAYHLRYHPYKCLYCPPDKVSKFEGINDSSTIDHMKMKHKNFLEINGQFSEALAEMGLQFNRIDCLDYVMRIKTPERYIEYKQSLQKDISSNPITSCEIVVENKCFQSREITGHHLQDNYSSIELSTTTCGSFHDYQTSDIVVHNYPCIFCKKHFNDKGLATLHYEIHFGNANPLTNNRFISSWISEYLESLTGDQFHFDYIFYHETSHCTACELYQLLYQRRDKIEKLTIDTLTENIYNFLRYRLFCCALCKNSKRKLHFCPDAELVTHLNEYHRIEYNEICTFKAELFLYVRSDSISEVDSFITQTLGRVTL